MANFEKIVKVTDAVLDCIPIVSSITNAAHAIYKLAHKVDALSPVAPGLKTSIKIHSLSKNNFDCVVGFVPGLGNIVKLVELVARALLRFDYKPGGIFGPTRDDDLITAVFRNNKEIVHLCLGNNALNDPDRADYIFYQSAYGSNNETFKQILNYHNDWSAQNLLHGLKGCWPVRDNNVANANDILDFWETHGRVAEAGNTYSVIDTVKECLKEGKVDLAGRILEILPDAIPFRNMQEILLKYSYAQYNLRGEVQGTGVLTAEQRTALIAKSTRPSLEELRGYYHSIGYQPSRDYRETHFDTLNKLFDLAQLQPDEIGEFIDRVLSCDEFDFIEPLVIKYEGKLTPQSKVKILKRLLPSSSWYMVFNERRVQLFASWTDKWKNDVSGQAHELYTDIFHFGNLHTRVAQGCLRMSAGAGSAYPSGESLQVVNDQFKQILLAAFPGCDQDP